MSVSASVQALRIEHYTHTHIYTLHLHTYTYYTHIHTTHWAKPRSPTLLRPPLAVHSIEFYTRKLGSMCRCLGESITQGQREQHRGSKEKHEVEGWGRVRGRG